MRVHILTPGFDSPNGRAFLFPLVVHARSLREAGLDIHFFHAEDPSLDACDRLMVDRKFHEGMWSTDPQRVIDSFAAWAARTRVIFCDTSDSAGWLHTALLPVVHIYAKAQLLADRTGYLTPHYGFRPFADYYHRKFGVSDTAPAYSTPVPDAALLPKLRTSWNSGLADYSLWGPFRMAAYQRLPLKALLRFPPIDCPAQAPRSLDVSCRFGTHYARASVAAQRCMIRDILADRLPTDKLPRRGYFDELRGSRIVASPFGWGEITLKDFEVFLTGGLLLKPDMSSIETWPNVYQIGRTYAAFNWDLSDIEVVIDSLLDDDARRVQIAAQGQDLYRRHTSGPDAAALFRDHLIDLLG